MTKIDSTNEELWDFVGSVTWIFISQNTREEKIMVYKTVSEYCSLMLREKRLREKVDTHTCNMRACSNYKMGYDSPCKKDDIIKFTGKYKGIRKKSPWNKYRRAKKINMKCIYPYVGIIC